MASFEILQLNCRSHNATMMGHYMLNPRLFTKGKTQKRIDKRKILVVEKNDYVLFSFQ